MADAPRDGNTEETITGASEIDDRTPITIYVNPDSDGSGTHGLVVEIA